MNRSLGTVIAAGVAFALWSSSARAEGGELYIGAEGALETARLGYPRPGMSGGADPWDIAGGGGVRLRYGLSDDWQVGLAWAMSRAGSVRHEGVAVEGREGDLFAEYGDMTLSVGGSYYFGTGYDFSVLLSVSAGVVWTTWTDVAIVDPKRTGADGESVRYPLNEQSSTNVGFCVGASLTGEWRPWGWFSLLVGPYVEMRQSRIEGETDYNVHIGLTFSPTVVLGVGPSL